MKTLTLSDSFAAVLSSMQAKCRCADLLLRAAGRAADGMQFAYTVKTANRYIAPDAPGDFITYRETSGMLSYCPKGRSQEFTLDGKWARRGRQDSKPAKLVRAVLHPRLVARIKPESFAEFATMFKLAEDSATLSITESDFATAYAGEHYRKESFSSCMIDEDVAPFYERAGAKAYVCKDATGTLRGRAILWPGVEFYCALSGDSRNGALLDRIYADSPEVTEFFCQWAQSNGHYRKHRQSMSCKSEFIAPDGNCFSSDITYTPQRNLDCGIRFYPYLDTLSWQDDSGGLRNTEDSAVWAYDCTGGARTEIEPEDLHEGEVEDIDGEWISEDEAVNVEGECYHNEDERITFCDRSQEHILTRDAYQVEIRSGEYITLHEDYVSRL